MQVPATADPETNRFLSICGTGFNGIALFRDIQANPVLFPNPAAADFVSWVEEVYGDFGTADPPAWNPEQLEYDVQVMGTAPDGKPVVFSARPAQDGGFDWHTFDLVLNAEVPGDVPAGLAPAAPFGLVP